MYQKKVLITGASKGIGQAIANILLSDKQFEVYGTSRKPDNLSDKIQWIEVDLRKPETIEDCFRKTGPVDILICNAGQSQFGPCENFPINKYKELFEINLFGTISLVQKYLPEMRKNRKGLIILIGSLTGEFPLPYFTSYSATKFALRGFARALRNEMAQFKVEVTIIEPNDIKTSIEPEMILEETSEYAASAQKARQVLRKNMENAQSPDVVARKVWHICQTRNPAPVYAVGGIAPLLVILKRLLPNRLVDYILRKMYGL